MIMLDALAIATCLLSWHAYEVAPGNEFTVAGDDLGFVVAALVCSGVFLVRTATLAVASVVTSRWLGRTRWVQRTPFGGVGRVVAVAAFATGELAATWLWWRASEDQLVPISLVQVSACLVSAATALALLPRARPRVGAVAR